MHLPTDNKRACDDAVENVESSKQARTIDTTDTKARSRRNWTQAEDELLTNAVKIFGGRNWRDISTLVPGRDWLQCNQRWSKTLRPGLRKGNWSSDEDAKLLSLLQESKDWQYISARIEGRSPKQCRERWSMNLDPSINRGSWTKEEDDRLVELSEKHNRKWAAIAREMAGRTESHVKTRMQTLMRRQAKERGWTKEQDQKLVDLITTHGRDCDAFLSEFPGQTRATLLRRFRIIVGDNSGVMIKALAADNKKKNKKGKKKKKVVSSVVKTTATNTGRTGTPKISGGMMMAQQQHHVQNIHQKLYQPRPYQQQQQQQLQQQQQHVLHASSVPRIGSGGMMLDIETIRNPLVGTWGNTPSPSIITSTATPGVHSGFSPVSSAASAMSTVTSSPAPWGPNTITARGFTPAGFDNEYFSHAPLSGDGQQQQTRSNSTPARAFSSMFAGGEDSTLHVPMMNNCDVSSTRQQQQQYFGPPIVRGQDMSSASQAHRLFASGESSIQQREHMWRNNNNNNPNNNINNHNNNNNNVNPGESIWNPTTGSLGVAMSHDNLEHYISSQMCESVRQSQMGQEVSSTPAVLSRIRPSAAEAQERQGEPSSL